MISLIYELAGAQARRGHKVVIYASDHQLKPEYVASLEGVEVHTFHCISNAGGFFIMPGIVAAARDNLKKFDIVHVHAARSFQNIIIWHYARKYGVPYVLDTHGTLPRMIYGKREVKWLLKWMFDIAFGKRILQAASKVIAETQVGVSEYHGFGLREDRIVLIPPPFDAGNFAQLPATGCFRGKFGIEDKRIVMFLGRIHYIKGLDFLVEAFHQLTCTRDDVILAIVGPDDGYRAELEKLIARLGLADRVLFTGFLGGKDRLAALVDADVVVQTSRYEQGARVPLEAILCGTPVIVSAHTGSGEDVGRLDAGYLVQFGNSEELARLISKIMEEPSEAKAKAGRAAEFIRKNRSIEETIIRFEKLYESCMQEMSGHQGRTR
ncbi:MAG: glycosyltransferase [Chloroflexi bacterium]|nr:glycosyltransferase [Chloroflexota bacterium]